MDTLLLVVRLCYFCMIIFFRSMFPFQHPFSFLLLFFYSFFCSPSFFSLLAFSFLLFRSFFSFISFLFFLFLIFFSFSFYFFPFLYFFCSELIFFLDSRKTELFLIQTSSLIHQRKWKL